MAAIGGVMAVSNTAAASQRFVQNQIDFRAALDNTSTAPSFILITVVDGRSGTQRTGCTMAGFLLHAIAAEEGIYRTDFHGIMSPDVAARVEARALASKDHVYTFRTPKALAAVPTEGKGSGRACPFIRAGLPAYMQDRSGRILAGRPSGRAPTQ